MKALPIGIQSFADLRTKQYLYVDKTEDIYRLITSGKMFFLSRPRRFGKSLLVSTLEAIFKGDKALFEELYVYDKIDWTQQHPVIRLDFGGINYQTPENLDSDLSGFFTAYAERYDISLNRKSVGGFAELIEKLHRQTGRQVVVLIDEYDKPIIDHLSKPELAQANREMLKMYYQVLKAVDEHLHFVFLTGVSKFAGVSIFSGLNNLNDITLDEKYASLCGYTQPEMESYFTAYIDELAQSLALDREKIIEGIRTWYNGYSWDGKTPVYNPFSTLLLFDKKQFDNYWFRTGTPAFLIELLKKRNQLESLLQPVSVDPVVFDSFDSLHINEVSLLFQTGYLTVKSKKNIDLRMEYTLGIPNNEVKQSLLAYLVNAYTDYPVYQTEGLKQRMLEQLRRNNTAGLEQSLREMLAYIPYPLHIGKEAYYHSLLLLWFKLLGFDITGEIMTNTGRIDAVLKLPGHVIVAEVKFLVKEGTIPLLLDEAMSQIKAMRYYEPYLSEQKVSLLGVAFCGKEIGCRMESLT